MSSALEMAEGRVEQLHVGLGGKRANTQTTTNMLLLINHPTHSDFECLCHSLSNTNIQEDLAAHSTHNNYNNRKCLHSFFYRLVMETPLN